MQMIKGTPIRHFTTFINAPMLGYHCINIYIKLHDASENTEKQIITYLQNHDKVDWFCVGDGKWDMIISVLAKNMARFRNFMNEFEQLFGKFINEKSISVLVDEYIMSHDYLVDDGRRVMMYMTEDAEKVILDKKNIELLKILSMNARMPLVELSKNIGISSDAVKYRIKWLQKHAIIIGFKLHLNYSNMKIDQSRLLLRLNSMSKEVKEKFLKNILNIPNVIYVRNCIAPWDMELHIISSGREEFRNTLKQITNFTPGVVKSYDLMRVYDVHKMDYFPLKT
ncbi:MAG: Lrp/AsnC family transcriptional regulator [Candidatus Aenigmarchaeota archaeon]|nr:Lrp/AsnC family transcriptional regulator [Candidatus Aenigmarchaeota archaeon]